MKKPEYVRVPKELIDKARTMVGAGGYSKDVIDDFLRALVAKAK